MFAWCTPSDVLYLLNLCSKGKSENKININKNDLFHDVTIVKSVLFQNATRLQKNNKNIQLNCNFCFSAKRSSRDRNVSLSVHHFGPDWSMLTIGWIVVKFSTDIRGFHWMNRTDFGDPDFSSSPIMRLKYLVFTEISQQLLDNLAQISMLYRGEILMTLMIFWFFPFAPLAGQNLNFNTLV